MTELTVPRAVAVIGTNVIGRSWMRVFARAGYETRVWDPDPAQVEEAWEWMKADLKRARRELGLRKRVAREERSQVVRCETLEEAVNGAVWVQESGPAEVEGKRAVFRQLDKLAPPKSVIASSSATPDMTTIAEGLSGASRCVIANPVNPPHVISLVEVVGGKRTEQLMLRRAVRFLERVGQIPVLLSSYVPGLLLGRLQAAVLREAIQLVQRGLASPEAVDTVVREGLGLRWALMGPFAVWNTTTDGGIREFFQKHGDAFEQLCSELDHDLKVTPQLVDHIARSVDGTWRRVPRSVQREWRDDMVVRIRALKDAYPIMPPDLD